MGLVMADQTAVLAGNIAQPDIANDQPGWAWRVRLAVNTSDVDDASQFIPVKERIKAMRRFPGNEQDFLLVINNPSLATVTLQGLVRVLVKKP